MKSFDTTVSINAFRYSSRIFGGKLCLIISLLSQIFLFFPQTANAQPYFPLKVGNQWQFFEEAYWPDGGISFRRFRTHYIAHEDTIDGKIWYQFSLDTCLYSYDNSTDTLSILWGADGIPRLYIDFRISPPASYSSYSAFFAQGEPSLGTTYALDGTVTVQGVTYPYKGVRIEKTIGVYPYRSYRYFVRGLGMLFMQEGSGYPRLLSAKVSDGDTLRVIYPVSSPVIHKLFIPQRDYTRSDDTIKFLSLTTNANSIPAWSYTWHNYPAVSYNDKIYIIKFYYQKDSLLRTDTSSFSLEEGWTEFSVPYDYNTALMTTEYKIYAVVTDKAVVPKYLKYPSAGFMTNMPFVHALMLDPMLNNNRYIYEEMYLDTAGVWRRAGYSSLEYSGQVILSNKKYIQIYKNSELYSYRRYDTTRSRTYEILPPSDTEYIREVFDLRPGDSATVARGMKQFNVTCDYEMPADSFGFVSIQKKYSSIGSDSLSYIYKNGIGLIEEQYYGELNGIPQKRKIVLRYAKVGTRIFGDTLWLTGVNEKEIKQKKAEIKLSVYPNPLNNAATFIYELPEGSIVNLKIFDILGREIATLVNEEKPAGNYEVEFNGTGIAPGIYFYRIQAGDFTETKKMMLVR